MPIRATNSKELTRKVGGRRQLWSIGLGITLLVILSAVAVLCGASISAFRHGVHVGVVKQDGYLSLAGQPTPGEGFSDYPVMTDYGKRHRRALRFGSHTLVFDTW
jgi:hypothetical protein